VIFFYLRHCGERDEMRELWEKIANGLATVYGR
jgi:hypothetical protein